MIGQAEFSKLNHFVYALHYHGQNYVLPDLVVVTKYRRRCLTAPMLARLREIATTMGEWGIPLGMPEVLRPRCQEWGGRLDEMNGEADHVHLLVSLPPNLDLDLSRFVNALKTNASRLLRKEFADELGRVYRKPVLWSRSYCIVSCGGAPLAVIRRYIEGQAAPK